MSVPAPEQGPGRLSTAANAPGTQWVIRIVFAICAVLAMNKLNSVDDYMAKLNSKMDDGLKELTKGQNRQDVKIAEINGKLDTVNTKIDSTVLYQLDDVKKRVERLEAASKVP